MMPYKTMNKDAVNIWEKALGIIKKEVDPRSFKLWFLPIKVFSFTDEAITLEVPDTFFKNWVKEHYLLLIKRAVSAVVRKDISIEFFLPEDYLKELVSIPPAARQTTQSFRGKEARVDHSGLNPNFIFDNFVVGSSNRLAHAAALAVGQSIGTAYNPLFIYGLVGLGKTHLMQAIGHFIKERGEYRVSYLPSEKFVNQYIDSIQNRTTNTFRNRFRNLDVLLLDDIHFLAGKERIQEEFFHTFNALYDNHKQVVISSDRPPKEIAALEKRLVSRFEWGLVADIQPPDLETRIAILKKKMEIKRVNFDEEVIEFIAERIKNNIRLLEGALTKLIACSSLFAKTIDLPFAKEVLKDIIAEAPQKPITVETILEKVAENFNLHISDLKGRRRIKSFILPRQIAMYLARRLTDNSLPQIGDSFGGKDHATIIYACKKIEKIVEKDLYFKEEIEKLVDRVKEG